MSGEIDDVLAKFFNKFYLDLYLVSNSKSVANIFGHYSILSSGTLSVDDIKYCLLKFISESEYELFLSKKFLEKNIKTSLCSEPFFLSCFCNNNGDICVVLRFYRSDLPIHASSVVLNKIYNIARFGSGLVLLLGPRDGSLEFVLSTLIRNQLAFDSRNIVCLGNQENLPKFMPQSSSTLIFLDKEHPCIFEVLDSIRPDVIIVSDLSGLSLLDMAIDLSARDCLVLFATTICFFDAICFLFASLSKYKSNAIDIFISRLNAVIFHASIKKRDSSDGLLICDEVVCSGKILESLKKREFCNVVSKIEEIVKNLVSENAVDLESSEKLLSKFIKGHIYHGNGVGFFTF